MLKRHYRFAVKRKLFPSCSDNDQTASKQKHKGVFFFIVLLFIVLDNYSKYGLRYILCHIFFIFVFLAFVNSSKSDDAGETRVRNRCEIYCIEI